jgi:hypothetical protein
MSTNCIRCGVNRRTGLDLLCDDCRPTTNDVVDQVYREAATITGKRDDQLRAMALAVFASMLQRAMQRPDDVIWTVMQINGATVPLPDRNRYIPPGALSVEVDVPPRLAFITGNLLALRVPGRGMYVIRELTDRYAIAAPHASSPAVDLVIFCRRCSMVSHNVNDVTYRYCGCCHQFLSDRIQPPTPASGEAVRS